MKQEKSLVRMMRRMFALSLIAFACFAAAQAQTSTFTYQGRSTDSTVAQPAGESGANYAARVHEMSYRST